MGLPLKKEKEEPLTMTIDKFGRVVIPQQVREALHLSSGSKLEIAQETEKTIVLKVVEEEVKLKWKDGVPLIPTTGEPVDWDIVEMIKKEREERNKKVGGISS